MLDDPTPVPETGEPVLDPDYWTRRLREAPDRNPHHAVFQCSDVRWAAIANRHRDVIARHVGPRDSVLDVGCGWGRLVDLLPGNWCGEYLGVDLCPEFILRAKADYSRHLFVCADVRGYPSPYGRPYDWAVLISFRSMVRRHSESVWKQIHGRLRRVSRRRLYLEYDEDGDGEVEE